VVYSDLMMVMMMTLGLRAVFNSFIGFLRGFFF